MKRTFSTELAYVFGIVFVALGVVLMEKADFGVSMVVAPAYLLYRWLSPVWSFVTFGMAEYCLQAVLLLVMCLLLRFRVSYLFSFVTAVVYGFVLDAFMLLGAALPAGSVWLRVIYYIKINEDLLMNYFLFKEAKQTVYEDFCPYHYILRKGSAATSKKRYHVTDPLRVRDMIRKDLHGDTQLYPVAYSRYVYTLITAAVQKQWPEESNVAKRQLKQEFRSREILNCDSKKLRLMALGAGFMLPVYRSVRWGYDRITGVSRKYDI